MIIMHRTLGNLRNNLSKIIFNPSDKFKILYFISRQLKGIHNGYGYAWISDLGIRRPVNQPSSENNIYGVLPYMTLEVLCEYAELMKRCWDNDPKKRSTAKELRMIFKEWDNKYPVEENDEKRVSIPGNYI
ncbi:hypothetical protein RclHR1_03140007 [Rhizophagus clarus]|uniref:Serine-threonine/tyrosine-protein kinase catalytic domain-containing protein n=1 Tax=Rhizophagus clarus TaxID=94130 RepID=A0A2Z6S275_9GLOM|nr:hypothetical protein RclHR1_03140007 [Rhizophagus clarus]